MKKSFIILIMVCMSLGLSGCLTTNEQGGALAGGVIGGIVGNQFGQGTGRAAATIAGTLVGAWAGSQWGKSLDEASRRKAMQAERRAFYTGEPTQWRSESYRGKVIPERTYYDDYRGEKCRRYKSVIWIDGEPQSAYGKACKVKGGRWEIIS